MFQQTSVDSGEAHDSGIEVATVSGLPSTSDCGSLLYNGFESTATVADWSPSAPAMGGQKQRRQTVVGANARPLVRRQSSSSVFYKDVLTRSQSIAQALVTASAIPAVHRTPIRSTPAAVNRQDSKDTNCSVMDSIRTLDSDNDFALTHNRPATSAAVAVKPATAPFLRLAAIPAVDEKAEAAVSQRSSVDVPAVDTSAAIRRLRNDGTSTSSAGGSAMKVRSVGRSLENSSSTATVMTTASLPPDLLITKSGEERANGATGDKSVSGDKEEVSLYERVKQLLATDPSYRKEVDLGKRIGFYRISRELGSGNFSKVKLGIHVLTKEKVAIKIMDKSSMDRKGHKLLKREIQNMENTHHPNVIHLFEVIDTLSRVYLCMEYADGGELYTHVIKSGRLSAVEIAPLYAQLLAAVNHLHSKEIVHRDIKAENVFFSGRKTVKLGDFGFSVRASRAEGQNFLNTFCGSPPYAAPELYRERDVTKSYLGEPVDIWALGILLYFMNTGYTPFRGETLADLKTLILDGTFTIPDYVDQKCKSLIVGILQQNPSMRLTLREMMSHSLVIDQCFPEAHKQYSILPDENDLLIQGANSVVPKVWRRMGQLGIQKDKLHEASDKGAASAIIGTYRIVLYQMLLHEGEEIDDQTKDGEGGGGSLMGALRYTSCGALSSSSTTGINDVTNNSFSVSNLSNMKRQRSWLKRRKSTQFCVIT